MNVTVAGESNRTATVGLAVVGTMLGRYPGHPVGAGEALAAHLMRAGYDVQATSSRRLRIVRLADIVATLLKRSDRIDVQILQVYSGLSFVLEDMASWIGVRLGQHLIMHVHGGGIPDFMERHPRWVRRVFKRAAAIVTPSTFLSRTLGAHGFRARVIPNAIDLSLYPYRRRERLEPRLLWMRTFHPIYNPQMAVRVLARVRETYPSATLVMAGQDKGEEQAVRNLAEGLGVAAAVRFVGFLDACAKLAYASQCDVYMNTNRVDNTPVTAIEACALGLPIVATKVGGIPDLLTHGETALLVPDNDNEAMAQAVVRLLNEPSLAGHLSSTARRLAERFSWAETQPLWEELIAEVAIADAPRRGRLRRIGLA